MNEMYTYAFAYHMFRMVIAIYFGIIGSCKQHLFGLLDDYIKQKSRYTQHMV